MSEGRVTLTIEEPFARIVIDNPASRNAMTFAMYDQLIGACRDIATVPELRAALIAGVAGSFCAGTDIREFLAFMDGEDGVRYEHRVEAVLRAIETLPVPTVAAVGGSAIGGGFLIAAACDFRIVSDTATFGAPIARSLGNALSLRNTARLERAVGTAALRRVLMLANVVGATEAVATGFAVELVPPDQLAVRAEALLTTLAAHAPLTIATSRAALARLSAGVPDDDDAMRAIYASDDFREGVRAFLEKRRPKWSERP